MKLKLFTALSLLTALMGFSDAQATTKNATVFQSGTAAQDLVIRNQAKTGDIVIIGGRRYVYVANDQATSYKQDGNVFYSGGTYVYGQTYTASSAANETRQIAAVTAEAESRILNDQITDRINVAMHGQTANAPGLLALGNGGNVGKNAGNQVSNVGVWAMYDYSNIKDTGRVSNFKGNHHAVTFGTDYLFSPCFLAGLAFTYGKINDGKYAIRQGKYEHDSYTAALYGALLLHQYFSIDAMIAAGKVNKKFKEKKITIVGDDIIVDADGPDLLGNTSSRRFMGTIFANGRYSIEKLNLWLRAGYSHTHDKEDSFNMSDATGGHATEKRAGGKINIGNLSARLRAGYRVHEMVEPYLQAGANFNAVRTKINADFGPAAKEKRFGWMVGGGFRLFGFENSLTGGVNYGFNKRGDTKVHNVTADVRYDFK